MQFGMRSPSWDPRRARVSVGHTAPAPGGGTVGQWARLEQPALALRWHRAPQKEGDIPSVRTADTQLGLAANPWPCGAEPQVTHWNSSVDCSCWDTGGQRASLAPLRPLLLSTWCMGREHESVGIRGSPLTHLTRSFNPPPRPPLPRPAIHGKAEASIPLCTPPWT